MWTKNSVLIYVRIPFVWRQLPWQPYHTTTVHAISETTLPDHWAMNESEAGFRSCSVFVFYSLRPHNSIQKTDPVWWPSGELLPLCVCASVHSDCAWEQGPQQVASSASITATPVTVYLNASCGLWACAQQSRLTVIPSGLTNHLSCLILACNSWMLAAALIRKNFHQQATHLCYEIWPAFSRSSILSFTDFQPSFLLLRKSNRFPNPCGLHFTYSHIFHAGLFQLKGF